MTLSSRELLGIKRQGTFGSGVNPDILIAPLPGTFQANEIFEQLLDTGRRGIDSMDFQAVQGVGRSEISWEGMVDEGNTTEKAHIGYLLQNILKSDTYTPTENAGSTGTYDHFLKQGNTKSYLTIEHDINIAGANDRRFIDCRVSELTFRFNAGEGLLTYAVTLMGQSPSIPLVTAQSLTDNMGPPKRGWEAAVVWDPDQAGTFDAITELVSGEITLRRAIEPFYSAQGQQTFSELHVGPLEVVGNVVLDLPDWTEVTSFRTRSQIEFAVTFTTGTADAASERTFAIGGSNFDIGDGPVELDNSNANIRVGLAIRGLYTTSNDPFSGAAQNGSVAAHITTPTVSTAYTA